MVPYCSCAVRMANPKLFGLPTLSVVTVPVRRCAMHRVFD